MPQIWLILALCCLSGIASQTRPIYILRKHHTNLQSVPRVEEVSSNVNRFQLAPSNKYEYALAETTVPKISFMDYVLNPVTAVLNVGSRVMSIIRWVINNGIQVLSGMVMTAGLCIFTSSCSITLANPFTNGLDNIQHYFTTAYEVYQNLQNDEYL